MSGAISLACAGAGIVGGGVAAGLCASLQVERIRRARLRGASLNEPEGSVDAGSLYESDDRVLRYAERLTRCLFIGATPPIAPCVRAKRAGKTRAGARYLERAKAAGCAKDITVSAFCEARLRIALGVAAAGALAGAVFSVELAVVLALAGAAFGASLPLRCVRKAASKRSVEAEQHLSEMLEVVALGLRSGLTFDRSFALYGSHFDSEFARSCRKAYRRWALGLSTREEALRDFAQSYDCEQLSRAMDSVIRSLRFGTALADILEDEAAQSRAMYRSVIEERVAKAPVKMMLPTGTLILPAMLLLVLGPILLELASGF